MTGPNADIDSLFPPTRDLRGGVERHGDRATTPLDAVVRAWRPSVVERFHALPFDHPLLQDRMVDALNVTVQRVQPGNRLLARGLGAITVAATVWALLQFSFAVPPAAISSRLAGSAILLAVAVTAEFAVSCLTYAPINTNPPTQM